jgi:hypothetical protein
MAELPRGSIGTPASGPRQRSVDWGWIVDRFADWVLLPYFVAFCAPMVVYFVSHGLVGIDARIYAHAASTWISGGDPWRAPVEGFLFAAPPPTLLPFLPFALLGETLSAVLWVSGSLVAGILLIRRLGLPGWWILFPPLVNGILGGNPDVVLVALLVMGGTGGAVIATFLKIYALVPILGERRWRPLLVTGGALLVTVPLLPWHTYLHDWDEIAATLGSQSLLVGGYPTVWLVVATAIALAGLGARSAGWLAVPALWPSFQPHYSMLALPVLARGRASRFIVIIAAMLYAPAIRWFPAAAVLVLFGGAIVTRLRSGPAKPDGRPVARRPPPR